MTEEFPSDTPSPNPAPDPSDDVAAETEVDALLAEAAELAAEVSEELEEIQPTGDDSTTSQASSADAALIPEAGDVDAQLAALDALIDQASQEIGQQDADSNAPDPVDDDTAKVDAPKAAEKPAPPADQQANPVADPDDLSAQSTAPETEVDMQQAMDAIPDFMQDLTGPAEEEPPADALSVEAPPTAASQSSQPSPTEATKDAAKTTEQELLATGKTRSLAPTTAPSVTPDQTPDTPPPVKPSRKPSLHIPPKISQTAASICDRAATVLEIIDRPTGRIGERTRVVMGLAALATLGTAIIVFLVSLF